MDMLRKRKSRSTFSYPTKRTQAEEEIRSKNQLLQGILYNLPIIIWRVDERGVITESIGLGLKRLGLQEYEAVGKKIVEIFPHSRGFFLKALRGEAIECEDEVVVYGSTCNFINYFFPDFRMPGVLLFSLDITDKRQAEKEVSYHASLLAGVSDAIVSTDLKFKIKSWNKGAVKIYGWTDTYAIGKDINSLLQTRYLSDSHQVAVDHFNKKGFWEGEIVQTNKDGKDVFIATSVTLLKDSRSNPIGTVAINRDITKQKEVEVKHNKLQQHLEEIFNSFPRAINYTDLEGNFIDVNDKYVNLTGYSKNELLGKMRYHDITPSEYHDFDDNVVNVIVNSGQPAEYEKEYLTKKGERIQIEITTFLAKDSQGKPVGYVSMMSEKKEKESF